MGHNQNSLDLTSTSETPPTVEVAVGSNVEVNDIPELGPTVNNNRT